GLDIYLQPEGFVEVTAENAGTRISPNLTLGEFVSKQESAYPKYVVIRSSLLLKLENILRNLNEAGHPVERFVIMSGYRTPFYNRAIGNVQYSRHVWGGAADIYVDDNPRDGRMDDMNGDGRIDRDDARWLANFVDGMSRRGEFGARIGGLGVYGSNAAHGPFIHVDVRGTRARW
ncbi:MAG: D-Ala-D-Ala carboxypeptidase family metallohydrolase, partial [Woeseiaceae bacterium]|nr:D-Ala-D-Ala carboxypeptidase family metallohydrolase [Woeseiaceae bacterium]